MTMDKQKLRENQYFEDWDYVNHYDIEKLIDYLGLDAEKAFKLYRWIVEDRMSIIEAIGLNDYEHRKSYDPITIEIDGEGNIIVHSYLFDLWDGGRSHYSKKLNIKNYPTMAKLLKYIDGWILKELTEK